MRASSDRFAPGQRAASAVALKPGRGIARARARRRGSATRGRTALRRVLLALVFPLFANVSIAASAASMAPWADGPTPPLALRDLDGRDRSLAALRGRVVVVNFWATWCAPCVQEMPSLQSLRDRYRDRGLEVLAVNFQENAARIRPFLERHGLDLTVLRDHDGSARSAWRVTVFPTTYVVAPDGTIAFSVVGEADWSTAPIEPAIRRLLVPVATATSSTANAPPQAPPARGPTAIP